MMNHSFDILIAKKYGVECAIFLNNMAYWIQKNSANHRNFKNGKFWTFNSHKAFGILFPYWTRQNIRTIIDKCIKKDLICRDNFNENPYDKTNWYSFTEKGLSLFNLLKDQIHSILMSNDFRVVNSNQHPLVDSNQCRVVNSNQCTLVDSNHSTYITNINKYIKTKKEKEKSKKRSYSPSSISDLYLHNQSHEVISSELGLDIELERKSFIDYYQSNGKKMIDWDASFRNWLRKAYEFKGNKQKRKNVVNSSIKDLKETLNTTESKMLLN